MRIDSNALVLADEPDSILFLIENNCSAMKKQVAQNHKISKTSGSTIDP